MAGREEIAEIQIRHQFVGAVGGEVAIASVQQPRIPVCVTYAKAQRHAIGGSPAQLTLGAPVDAGAGGFLAPLSAHRVGKAPRRIRVVAQFHLPGIVDAKNAVAETSAVVVVGWLHAAAETYLRQTVQNQALIHGNFRANNLADAVPHAIEANKGSHVPKAVQTRARKAHSIADASVVVAPLIAHVVQLNRIVEGIQRKIVNEALAWCVAQIHEAAHAVFGAAVDVRCHELRAGMQLPGRTDVLAVDGVDGGAALWMAHGGGHEAQRFVAAVGVFVKSAEDAEIAPVLMQRQRRLAIGGAELGVVFHHAEEPVAPGTPLPGRLHGT